MPLDTMDALLKRFNEAQAQLVIQTADLPLGTLADMVEHGSIDLEPAFQRRERWSVEKQSALVESFLLNVPVPPVYLAEEPNGKYTAIDGKQRLRAIADFFVGRFALKSLERLTEAEGCRFADLPEEITNPLRLRPFLRVVTLLKQSNKALKYEVFLRLNRGGEALNPQEIRNVAFRGAMNDAIFDVARTPFLQKQLKISDGKSAAYRSMEDAELVLRFLTLYERFGRFSGKLVREMDLFLSQKQDAAPQEVARYKSQFLTALSRCERLWGDLAFKRPEKEGWRHQLLAGMFDAQMLAVASLDEAVVEAAAERQDRVISETRQLFSDRQFEEAVRAGTNTPQRIDYRVSMVRNMLQSMGNV